MRAAPVIAVLALAGLAALAGPATAPARAAAPKPLGAPTATALTAPGARTQAAAGAVLTTDLGHLSLVTPGLRFTLLGSGYQPSSTVTITLDTTALQSSTVDATGALSLPIALPADLAGGAHTLSAAGTDPSGADHTLTLAVTTPPTALTSSGVGEQWVTIPVPEGGWVTLLDNNRDPVTATTFRGQGTYTLDPASGQISFQPYHHFYGLAQPATYQLTDANGQSVTGTYQARVEPRAIPAIRTGKRTLTSADGTSARIGCTAGPVAVERCEATVTALVGGEKVVLAQGSATSAPPVVGTLNIDLAVTEQGRKLAGMPGGWPTDVTVTMWLPPTAANTAQAADATNTAEAPDIAGPLTVTDTTQLTALRITAPRPIQYPAGGVDIPDADLPYLNALRSRMSDVQTVICAGGTDNQGSEAANKQTALDRAQRVCDYLTARTRARALVRVADQPVAGNDTAAGQARNRRTEITFSYATAESS